MEAQQIFDKVVAHLRQQGKAAIDNTGQCVYRTVHGHKCAVGCLIADEDYIPAMEGKMANTLLVDFADKPSIAVLAPHQEMLADLQSVHDQSEPDHWERKLALVADNYGLTYTRRR